MRPIFEMRLEPLPGAKISECVEIAKSLARPGVPVGFRFNELNVRVSHDTDVWACVQQYIKCAEEASATKQKAAPALEAKTEESNHG